MSPDDFQKLESLIRGILNNGVNLEWWVYPLTIIVAALGGYLGSYFRKSGEYLAMEDNIGTITKITEEVKKQFASNLALLTANLQIFTKSKINISEKEQNALDNFYIDCAELIYERILANSSQINDYNASSYQDFFSTTLRAFKKIYISYHKVLLFLQHDANIIAIVGPMFRQIQRIEKIFLDAFEQLRSLSQKKDDNEVHAESMAILKKFASDLDIASKDLSQGFADYLTAVGKYYQSLKSIDPHSSQV